MKLLTTIAALLLSFSAFSQDYIEYRDFKFYQNGSEISFEEVTELTKEYRVARVAFRQGRKDFAASQSTLRATKRNLTYTALAIPPAVGGGVSVSLGILDYRGGLIGPLEPDRRSGAQFIALGTFCSGVSTYCINIVTTKKRFKKRADEKFHKTAQKLNEAIKIGKRK